jgi:hypothetical protein
MPAIRNRNKTCFIVFEVLVKMTRRILVFKGERSTNGNGYLSR